MEWWSQQTGILIGSLGGAGVGVIGGLYGSLVGVFAPRGRLRGPLLGFHLALIVCGAIALIAGIVAVLMGQPYHVFYPLLLGGGIDTLVMGALYPVVRLRYRQAESRRMEARLLRDG